MTTLSPSCFVCAFPGSLRLNSCTCLPSCSKTTRSSESALGAETATSTGVDVPTNFSGLAIWIPGPGMRPATTHAPPPAAAASRMRMSRKRRMGDDDNSSPQRGFRRRFTQVHTGVHTKVHTRVQTKVQTKVHTRVHTGFTRRCSGLRTPPARDIQVRIWS